MGGISTPIGERGNQPVRPGQEQSGNTSGFAGDIVTGRGNQGNLCGAPVNTSGRLTGNEEDDEGHDEHADTDLTSGDEQKSDEGDSFWEGFKMRPSQTSDQDTDPIWQPS